MAPRSGRGAAIASAFVVAMLVAGIVWSRRVEAPAKPARGDVARRLGTFANVSFVNYVRKDGAELHMSPDASSRVLRKEPQGTQIEMGGGAEGDWLNVRDGDLQGWMRADEIGLDPP